MVGRHVLELTAPTPEDIRRSLSSEPEEEDDVGPVYVYPGEDACRLWVTSPDCPGGRWWGGEHPAQMSPATAAQYVRRITAWPGWTAEVRRLDPWTQGRLL